MCTVLHCREGFTVQLHYGNQVKLSIHLIEKECTLFGITAAPMLGPTGYQQEIARPDALLACSVLIEVSAFDDNDAHIVCMCMRSSVEPWDEPGDPAI